MSVTSGFFNSLNGDRKYDARQFSSIFSGVIRDGVFMSVGGQLMITAASTEMRVEMAPGRAWFDGGWLNNDAQEPINLELSDLLFPRIDAIVMEFNNENDTRDNFITVLKGTPSATPTKPSMFKSSLRNQYPLAYVYLDAGQTVITDSDIENAIGLSETPFVTGILDTIDASELINQWRAQFTEWLNVSNQTFVDFMTASGNTFDTQLETWVNEFTAWQNNFEDTAELWYNTQTQTFDSWSADQRQQFELWTAAFMSEANTWYATRKNEFDVWFANIKAVLDENVAANLYRLITDLDTKASNAMVYNFTAVSGVDDVIFETTMSFPTANDTKMDAIITFETDVIFGDTVSISDINYTFVYDDGSLGVSTDVIFELGSTKKVIIDNTIRKIIVSSGSSLFDSSETDILVKGNKGLNLEFSGEESETQSFDILHDATKDELLSLLSRSQNSERHAEIVSYNPTGAAARLGVKINPSGDKNAYAPTPNDDANTEEIITAEWFRNFIQQYMYTQTQSDELFVPIGQNDPIRAGYSNLVTPAYTATTDPDLLTIGRALVRESVKMPDTEIWYVDTIFYTGTEADKSAIQIAREYTNKADGKITKGVYVRGKLNANTWSTNWTLISPAVTIGTTEYVDGVTAMAKGSIYYQIEE